MTINACMHEVLDCDAFMTNLEPDIESQFQSEYFGLKRKFTYVKNWRKFLKRKKSSKTQPSREKERERFIYGISSIYLFLLFSHSNNFFFCFFTDHNQDHCLQCLLREKLDKSEIEKGFVLFINLVFLYLYTHL